jgi:hypothetical protein
VSTFDAIRAAVDAAEAADNAEFDAWQQTVAGLKQQIATANATIADLQAQLAALQPAIKWGSSVWPIGKQTYTQALARVDQMLTPELLRHYCTGAPSWPNVGSHSLVISFKLLPAEVLAGKWDTQLATFFAATPRPSYWSYWHEPEDNIAKGQFTAADYRAAWAHIAAIAKASGKPLRSVLILMGWTLKPAARRTWTDYYPGADVIDVLGWDEYVWTATDDPAKTFDLCRTASAAAGKPWRICETGVGSVQHPDPAVRGGKLTALARSLTGAEFVTYFDSAPDGKYHWQISDDPAAAGAWKAGRAA